MLRICALLILLLDCYPIEPADARPPDWGGLISASLRWEEGIFRDFPGVTRGVPVDVTLLLGHEFAILILPKYHCALTFRKFDSEWVPYAYTGVSFSDAPDMGHFKQIIVDRESRPVDKAQPARGFIRGATPSSQNLQVVVPKNWDGDRALTEKEWTAFKRMALKDVRLSGESSENSVTVFLPKPRYLDPQAWVVTYWHPGSRISIQAYVKDFSNTWRLKPGNISYADRARQLAVERLVLKGTWERAR